MAGMFTKGFNKFADFGNALNKGANKLVGKDVFGEIRKIEEPKEFPPLDSYPPYTIPEPEQWHTQSGSEKTFTLEGSTISVSSVLDTCMKYRPDFLNSAKYYAERFEFEYKHCVTDFDSFIHYFPDLYFEGLGSMAERACGLLLSFGIFSADAKTFASHHNYHAAYDSYDPMRNLEQSQAQTANKLGSQVGGAIQMQGGGFGIKGAMKGIAKAEAFNVGMGLLGKYVENQTKMSPEEKANAFAKFHHDILFKEVYADYSNTFLTFIQVLVDNQVLVGVTTEISNDYSITLNNLSNPMFPQDKFAQVVSQLIMRNPFVPMSYELLRQHYGDTEEVKKIIQYFVA